MSAQTDEKKNAVMASKTNRVSNRMRSFLGPSVWVEFTPLARLTNAVNLGQGFPGWPPPPFLRDALVRASKNDACQQYAQPMGSPLLRNAVADTYSKRLDFQINPDLNVLVTVGASQALSLACHVLLQDGDEVVLFEPAFDIYTGAARMAGATTRGVPLRIRDPPAISAHQLYIDMDELAAVMNERTRMLILNSPHNPTGKVFSREEQVEIAKLIDEKCPQCIVLSDEVYEHLVFDQKHVPFASVSETARNRTLSVYSAGKTFSATGWKIGWVLGADKHIMKQLRIAQQYVVFSVCSNSQTAVAEALKTAELPFEGFESYYQWLCEQYRTKRDFLVETLRDVGMSVIVPDGAFYVLASPSDGPLRNTNFPSVYQNWVDEGSLEIDPSTINRDDYNLCRNLTVNCGVAAIPPSAFFSDEHLKGNALAKEYARFAFCKPLETIEAAKKKMMDASIVA